MLYDFWARFINIIYPAQCLSCKKTVPDETIVCRECINAIEKNVPPFCPCCGRSLEKGKCPHCKKINFYFERAWSVCHYRNTGAELIHLFKYKGKTKLSGILAKIMSDFIEQIHLPINTIDVIVPIPLHATKLREREFNQSELLSSHISRTFKVRHSTANLIRIHNSKVQARLKANSRFINIEGAFRIKDKHEFTKKNVLVVDDVLTTGATVSEASRILKASGAKSVFVLTFAS